jgi:hypothetical protein
MRKRREPVHEAGPGRAPRPGSPGRRYAKRATAPAGRPGARPRPRSFEWAVVPGFLQTAGYVRRGRYLRPCTREAARAPNGAARRLEIPSMRPANAMSRRLAGLIATISNRMESGRR